MLNRCKLIYKSEKNLEFKTKRLVIIIIIINSWIDDDHIKLLQSNDFNLNIIIFVVVVVCSQL